MVVKPLNDVLREKQRDAMVAYLLARPDIVGAEVTDINRLFEYLLIDVGMGAAMMTSRLKQAISSVQLFTQRYFLNLEANLAPALLDDKQWEWMKNYRVWEANRKVFLYPENWIEPDLRLAKDKSPFFKDFENQLLQNEVTEINVETALLSYLEKVDEVSRLEICGVYEENEGGVDLFHVFGRTSNKPAVYYYRQFDALLKVWTPWEKVTLDIEGDELIPVVWNRRLCLFWATFEEKPEKKSAVVGPSLEDWVKKKQASDSYSGQYVMWYDIKGRWASALKRYLHAPPPLLIFNALMAFATSTFSFLSDDAVPPGSWPEDPDLQPIADAEQQQWIDNQAQTHVDLVNGQLQMYDQAKGQWDHGLGEPFPFTHQSVI
jgi:Neuraminidase-like domain